MKNNCCHKQLIVSDKKKKITDPNIVFRTEDPSIKTK